MLQGGEEDRQLLRSDAMIQQTHQTFTSNFEGSLAEKCPGKAQMFIKDSLNALGGSLQKRMVSLLPPDDAVIPWCSILEKCADAATRKSIQEHVLREKPHTQPHTPQKNTGGGGGGGTNGET